MLFPAAGDDARPAIHLRAVGQEISADTDLDDIAKILGRYRAIIDTEEHSDYKPIVNTPQLNAVLNGLAAEKAKVVIPYQSMDEVGAKRIVNDVNDYLEEHQQYNDKITFLTGVDGPRHIVSPDNIVYLEHIGRFSQITTPSEMHVQRIKDLGMGLGMFRSKGFQQHGAAQDDPLEGLWADEEPFVEGVEEIADVLPNTVDRTFVERLAERRAREGSGPAIGGSGKKHGPAHVVDMEGKTWTGRTDGSGE